MGEIIAIAIPLLVGYVIALAVYMGSTFAFAGLFRSALASEGRPLPGFYAASAMAWLFSTICACYYVVTQAPYPWEMGIIALAILIMLFRGAYDFNAQQPRGLVLLCAVTVAGGAALVWQMVS